jgi:hypothetical protein
MAKFYTDLTQPLVGVILYPSHFFVAAAPQTGRINLPPNGRLDYLPSGNALSSMNP